jgi:hypothetical protein
LLPSLPASQHLASTYLNFFNQKIKTTSHEPPLLDYHISLPLGQALMTSIVVYNYQKEKQIDYFHSVITYMKAEIGYFIVGFIGILCVCFIVSDFIDLSVTREDLKSLEQRTWKENMQLYFKSSAFVVACFIQYIAFRFRDKGKDAIDKAIDKIK